MREKEYDTLKKNIVNEVLGSISKEIDMHRIVFIIGDDNLPISTQYGDVLYYLTQGIRLTTYPTYEACMEACRKLA